MSHSHHMDTTLFICRCCERGGNAECLCSRGHQWVHLQLQCGGWESGRRGGKPTKRLFRDLQDQLLELHGELQRR